MRSRSTALRHFASGGKRSFGMLPPEGARGQVIGVLHPGGIMLSTRFLRRALAALPATLLFRSGERSFGMLPPEGARGQVIGVLHPGGIMLSTRFLRRALAALPATLLL